jgi:hypothetical protein
MTARVFSAVLLQRNRDQSSADQVEALFCQFLFIIDLLSAVEICVLCRVLNNSLLETPRPGFGLAGSQLWWPWEDYVRKHHVFCLSNVKWIILKTLSMSTAV